MNPLERNQQEGQDAGALAANQASRDSRGQSGLPGNGLQGEAIAVNMTRLADVLGKRRLVAAADGARCSSRREFPWPYSVPYISRCQHLSV